jgi:hypothetical protein
MNLLINVLVAVVVFWLVYTYLLPLLPEPVRGIAFVLFVLCAIVYVLRLLV